MFWKRRKQHRAEYARVQALVANVDSRLTGKPAGSPHIAGVAKSALPATKVDPATIAGPSAVASTPDPAVDTNKEMKPLKNAA